MKLNPEELQVTSFETNGDELVAVPTTDGPVRPIDTIGTIGHPTPMTFCYWCPPKTLDCM
jgi:hypothetical protein